MGNAARKHNNDCHDCHKSHDDCGCDHKEVVLSRESLEHHHHGDCVRVCGDFEADEHDEIIIVYGNGDNLDPAGNQLPSNVHLPCPDDLDECRPMAVIAVDAPVLVHGLHNEDVVGADGRLGTGSVRLEIGETATFRAIRPVDKCDCPFFIACICVAASPSPSNGNGNGNGQ